MTPEPADIYSFVGARIRHERKARGFTLEELSHAAGMNTGFLHLIENNKKKVSLGMLARIADALHVSMEQLFHGVPTKPEPDLAMARKVGFLLKDATPKKRARIISVVKTLAKAD